jgi:Holliday junction resolvase RusA-like endonuclease
MPNTVKDGDGIIATMTIFGNLPSIKNRRRLIPAKGNRRPMIIKSKDAMDYEQAFLMAIPQKMRVGYNGPVSLSARIYYQSRRSDLSVELLYDLIAKASIILNDRQIMHCECWKGLSKESPRVHFTVKKWEGDNASL